MIVKIIPGPRNEELIAVLLAAKETMEEDEFPEFIENIMQDPDTLMKHRSRGFTTRGIQLMASIVSSRVSGSLSCRDWFVR